MDRLTCYFDNETAVPRGCCTFDRESNTEPDDCISCGEMCEENDSDCSECPIQKAFNKLAEYEDMEEQGRLVKFPCAIGDKYYEIVDKCNFPDDCYTKAMCKGCDYREVYIEEKIASSLSDMQHVIYYLNKIVFLTRELADKALEEMKGAEKNNEQNKN